LTHPSTLTQAQPAKEEKRGASIRFPSAPPGLDGAHTWELVEHEAARPFLWLRSVDRPGLSLLVIDPRVVVRGYQPKISSAELARIGLAPSQNAVMLSVVTLEEEAAFANLVAPILINPDELVGTQVILDDAEWPLRHPIMPDPVAVDGTGRSQQCSCSVENPDSPSSSGRKSE